MKRSEKNNKIVIPSRENPRFSQVDTQKQKMWENSKIFFSLKSFRVSGYSKMADC
jgi:hypothetical protein